MFYACDDITNTARINLPLLINQGAAMSKSINKFTVISLVLISIFLFGTYAFCQQSPLIISGIEQYK